MVKIFNFKSSKTPTLLPSPLDGFVEPLRLLYFWGVWPGKTKSIGYTIFRITIHLFCTVLFGVGLTVRGIGTVIIELQDLGNVKENMYTMFIGFYTYCIKMTNLFLKKKQIQELLDKMDKCLVLDSNDDEERELVAEGIKTSKTMFRSITTTYVLIVVAASLKPFFSPFPILIFPCVFPFDWTANWMVMGLVYIFQFYGGMSQSVISACADSLTGICLGTVGGYINALGRNFERLQYDENGKYEVDEEKKLARFRILAVKYTNIMEILHNLEDIFSEAYAINFFIGCLAVCTAAFQISLIQLKGDFSRIYFMIAYVISMLAQCFLPCYFGTQMKSKTDQLLHDLGSSKWMIEIRKNKKLNQNIFVFMEFLKKPAQIRSVKFFELSLSTFTSIINFTYSVYNLLHRFVEMENGY